MLKLIPQGSSCGYMIDVLETTTNLKHSRNKSEEQTEKVEQTEKIKREKTTEMAGHCHMASVKVTSIWDIHAGYQSGIPISLGYGDSSGMSSCDVNTHVKYPFKMWMPIWNAHLRYQIFPRYSSKPGVSYMSAHLQCKIRPKHLILTRILDLTRTLYS